MSSCPHCGQAVADGATFCGACGKPLTEGVTREVEGYHAGKEIAGIWPRLGASIIDGIVVMLAVVAFAAVLYAGAAMTPADGDAGGGAVVVMLIGFVGMIAAWFGLPWRFNARGTSPGARAAHVRIIDRVGNAPGVGRGLGRMLVAMLLSSNLISLGYLWAIWDRENRTWHDHLAGTWVVKDE